jgi:hypothetical protein
MERGRRRFRIYMSTQLDGCALGHRQDRSPQSRARIGNLSSQSDGLLDRELGHQSRRMEAGQQPVPVVASDSNT